MYDLEWHMVGYCGERHSTSLYASGSCAAGTFKSFISHGGYICMCLGDKHYSPFLWQCSSIHAL